MDGPFIQSIAPIAVTVINRNREVAYFVEGESGGCDPKPECTCGFAQPLGDEIDVEEALSHQASKGVPFSLSERGQASQVLDFAWGGSARQELVDK